MKLKFVPHPKPSTKPAGSKSESKLYRVETYYVSPETMMAAESITKFQQNGDSKISMALSDEMRQVLAEYPRLDIYAKPGTKVRAIFMNGKPHNGYPADQEDAGWKVSVCYGLGEVEAIAKAYFGK